MRHSAFKRISSKLDELGSKDAQDIKKGMKQQKSHKAESRRSLAITIRTKDQWSPSEHPVGEYSTCYERIGVATN